MAQVSREPEHTVSEEAGSDNVLANLSEEEENRVRLREIQESTVAENTMKLPVSTVTTAENSNQWAIEVEHPIEGTLRFYLDSPTQGWSNEPGTIVRAMDWYDINDDPYQLQLMRVYVEYTDDEAEQAHGWELVEPPDYDAPIREQLQEKKEKYSSYLTVGGLLAVVIALSLPVVISWVVNTLSYHYIIEAFISVAIFVVVVVAVTPAEDDN